jgi:shikimate kinase
MKIYLIGYMGSGKSTLGFELAEVLGIPWKDLDDEFELRYKISISNFFEKYGENAFRELEHKLLTEFASIPDIVVSTGGGTPCFFGNMDIMNRTGLTIYLSGEPELLVSRINISGRKRPLFQQMKNENLLQNISRHLNTRKEYYEKAQMIVDASKPDIPELRKLILSHQGHITGL